MLFILPYISRSLIHKPEHLKNMQTPPTLTISTWFKDIAHNRGVHPSFIEGLEPLHQGKLTLTP